MVIMTAKLSKSKLIAIALLLVMLIVIVSICLSRAGKSDAPQAETQSQTSAADESVKTNDDRVAFLTAFGWEVSSEPVQTQQVRVPTDPSEVFLRYNELQRSQGYDLSTLAGKTLNRYVYEVLNYPDADGKYYATLLVYKDAVVGGDVCSNAKNGVMHGFAMPD